MVFCVEPMVCAGGHAVRMGDDNWAIYSEDGSLTAHFEHTVAITAEGPGSSLPGTCRATGRCAGAALDRLVGC